MRLREIARRTDNTMSNLPDARRMLELAERAAIDRNFSSADELLREAARIQEAEMGPLHPDLANTLNSLAIVAERTGRFADAESFYRRSAAIASESLPADHPIVAESRKNLEDFCRERGVPLVPPAAMTPSGEAPAVGLGSFAPEVAPGATAAAAPARNTSVTKQREPLSSSSQPVPAVRVAATPAPISFPAVKRSSWRKVAWLPIGAIVLLAVAVLMRQQPSPSQGDSTTPAIAPVTEPEPPPPPPPVALPPPPTEQTPPAEVVTQDSDRSVVAEPPPAAAPSSGTISVAFGQLCQTFSTGRDTWQCDPPGDTVEGGPIVFYTRVRSPRDAEVVHRWYYGDTLRQTVRLMIRANVSEGYRTYSRHLVDRVGNWRVEATTDAGDVLLEQRFTVR